MERLAALNRKARQEQWRGIALWCRNPPGGEADRRLEDWSAKADIGYWKIDIGDPSFRLTALRDETRLPLTLEHVHGELPVNGDWHKNGRSGLQPGGPRRLNILAHTDVYRTYDVTSILSLPTTLDRVAEMLKGAEGHPEVSSLLNVEDEVYVAAVLGRTDGYNPSSSVLRACSPGPDTDLFFTGPRRAKRRTRSSSRLEMRSATGAAFLAPGQEQLKVSEDVLTDSRCLERWAQTWQNDLDRINRPAGRTCVLLTRNLDLPHVQSRGRETLSSSQHVFLMAAVGHWCATAHCTISSLVYAGSSASRYRSAMRQGRSVSSAISQVSPSVLDKLIVQTACPGPGPSRRSGRGHYRSQTQPGRKKVAALTIPDTKVWTFRRDAGRPVEPWFGSFCSKRMTSGWCTSRCGRVASYGFHVMTHSANRDH